MARTSRLERQQGGLTGDARVSMASGGGTSTGRSPIRILITVLVIAAVLLVSTLVGFLVLSNTSAFTILSIDAEDTEHLSSVDIAKLANVPEGTTLLNFDEAVIEENLKRNPWVSEAQFIREFPDRLQIVIVERKVDCLVKMDSGLVCWCLGDDFVWIEPLNLNTKGNQSVDDVALALARDMGALLITDAPTSMVPSAGSVATDEVLRAISSYRQQFSSDFASQVICYSAASTESIACTLSNGVEVSLGAPTNIDAKEAVIREILARHPNQVTYINVRVPSQPSYRKIGTESVAQGTGVQVDLLQEEEQSTPTEQATGDESSQQQEDQQSSEQDWSDDGWYDDSYSDYGDYYDEGYVEYDVGYDTGDMILGEDGNYYTYEDYYGDGSY